MHLPTFSQPGEPLQICRLPARTPLGPQQMNLDLRWRVLQDRPQVGFEEGILIERAIAAMGRSFQEGRWVDVA